MYKEVKMAMATDNANTRINLSWKIFYEFQSAYSEMHDTVKCIIIPDALLLKLLK